MPHFLANQRWRLGPGLQFGTRIRSSKNFFRPLRVVALVGRTLHLSTKLLPWVSMFSVLEEGLFGPFCWRTNYCAVSADTKLLRDAKSLIAEPDLESQVTAHDRRI